MEYMEIRDDTYYIFGKGPRTCRKHIKHIKHIKKTHIKVFTTFCKFAHTFLSVPAHFC